VFNLSDKTECVAGDTGLVMALSTLKILSYNVWFQDLEIDKRMEALGDVIQLHAPDVICFQVCHLVFIT
jgi:tyrosyl-DNA phosphodiesterase 2